MEEDVCSQIVMNLKNLCRKNQKENIKQTFRKNLYKCAICKDTGWIIRKVDGRTLARSCECRNKQIIKNQWRASGINLESRSQTFTNFKIWNNESKLAKEVSMAYVTNFDNVKNKRKNSLILCGQVGSGKTHLAIAAALNLIDRHVKAVYMPYRDSITRLKQNIMDQEYYHRLIAKYQTAELLIIDDLYKGKVNESDVNIVFEIINYRYLNHLPVIISSEFTLDLILSFDESIGSRIYEMCKEYIVQIPKDIKNNYRLR